MKTSLYHVEKVDRTIRHLQPDGEFFEHDVIEFRIMNSLENRLLMFINETEDDMMGMHGFSLQVSDANFECEECRCETMVDEDGEEHHGVPPEKIIFDLSFPDLDGDMSQDVFMETPVGEAIQEFFKLNECYGYFEDEEDFGKMEITGMDLAIEKMLELAVFMESKGITVLNLADEGEVAERVETWAKQAKAREENILDKLDFMK